QDTPIPPGWKPRLYGRQGCPPLLRKMVELQPIRMKHVNHFVHALQSFRSTEVRGGAEFVGALDIAGLFRMRQHNDRQPWEVKLVADDFQYFKAVQPRHL